MVLLVTEDDKTVASSLYLWRWTGYLLVGMKLNRWISIISLSSHHQPCPSKNFLRQFRVAFLIVSFVRLPLHFLSVLLLSWNLFCHSSDDKEPTTTTSCNQPANGEGIRRGINSFHCSATISFRLSASTHHRFAFRDGSGYLKREYIKEALTYIYLRSERRTRIPCTIQSNL